MSKQISLKQNLKWTIVIAVLIALATMIFSPRYRSGAYFVGLLITWSILVFPILLAIQFVHVGISNAIEGNRVRSQKKNKVKKIYQNMPDMYKSDGEFHKLRGINAFEKVVGEDRWTDFDPERDTNSEFYTEWMRAYNVLTDHELNSVQARVIDPAIPATSHVEYHSPDPPAAEGERDKHSVEVGGVEYTGTSDISGKNIAASVLGAAVEKQDRMVGKLYVIDDDEIVDYFDLKKSFRYTPDMVDESVVPDKQAVVYVDFDIYVSKDPEISRITVGE